MTDTASKTIGWITGVQPGSAAAAMGIQPGDGLLSVNGNPCEDVIDVQFFGAENRLTFEIQRGEEVLILRGRRKEGQALGLDFDHPTFDIDIRRCNNLCPFCFVLQMPKGFRRTLSIKDDDYRYSFLFGHFVTLTNLNDHDWQRILTQRLSPLYVSVHATEPDVRAQCLRNDKAPDVLAQIRELGQHHIEVHTQLVITPGLNDGAHMERSIEDLSRLWPTVASVSVVPVGLTKHHRYGRRAHTREEAQAVLDVCDKWQKDCIEHLGVRFVYPTDEWYLVAGRELPQVDAYDDLELYENGLGMVRRFLDEWQTIRKDEVPSFEPKVRHATLATATLFAPTLEVTARELADSTGTQIDVISIVNEKLGDGITVAGLLMAEDVINTLKTRELGEVVILPRIMFDHPDGVSLDDVSPLQVAQALGRPIALADWMGDVLDAMNGTNPLMIDPVQGLIHPDKIVRDGGWAVEKYL